MTTRPPYQIPEETFKEIIADYLKWVPLKDLSQKYKLSETMIFHRLNEAGVKRDKDSRPSKNKKKLLEAKPPEKEVKRKKINIATPNGHFNVHAFDKVKGRNWIF